MFLARVTGSVIATQKVASMTGHKLLTVEPYRVDEKQRDKLVPTGRTFVVVDSLGAGVGEMVLICQGSSARLTQYKPTQIKGATNTKPDSRVASSAKRPSA